MTKVSAVITQDGIEIHCAHREMMPIEEIGKRLNKDNRNNHPPEQIDELVEQYKYQGVRHPIILSKRDGKMTAGEGRYQAAVKLGMTAFPVDLQSWSDEDSQYAFGIADNSLQSWSALDLSSISKDLEKLDGMSFDINRLAIKDFVVCPSEKIDILAPEKPRCPTCNKPVKVQ